jgi:putative transposase
MPCCIVACFLYVPFYRSQSLSLFTDAELAAIPVRPHDFYGEWNCTISSLIVNERTGTPCNFLEFPTDVVLLVVRWRLRYRLSLRNLAEMFHERGFEFTHEAERDWEARFAPLIADCLRAKRRGQAGSSWCVDGNYSALSGSRA